VKVEQEIRHIPERDRRDKVDRFVPLVEAMAATEVGRSELAAICAFYLQEHRPETTVREETSVARDDDRPRDERPGGPRRDGGRRRRRRRPGGR
jgi:hypothetical protein